MKNLPVLLVGFEMAPFFKVGGLGDVMGSLPKALSKIGVDIRVVIPYYLLVGKNLEHKKKKIGEFNIHFGDKDEQIGVYETKLAGTKVIVYFLSNRLSFSEINTRGKNKRIDQFAMFSLAVSQFIPWLLKNEHWAPKLIHLNDWHTAFVPLLLQKSGIKTPTLLSIHNLNYQGIGWLKVLDLLHIKDEELKTLKRGGRLTEINILGEGILHATEVSTVSPTYAKEIYENYQHDQIHYFLDKRKSFGSAQDLRKDRIIGILNGVDYEIWDPEHDELIFHKFGKDNWEEGKKNNKKDLLTSLGLEERPTFCFIGRMVWQKGIEFLVRAVKRIDKLDFNLIFLGQGMSNVEKGVEGLAKLYPDNIKAVFEYSEEMAHKIYAGSDFMIVPSRYEPCGLVQMIAMKYGTIPLVSKTGGLKDSVIDGENGLVFRKKSVSSLEKSIKDAVKIYHDLNRMKFMITRALKADFSWDKSANQYKKLYEGIIHSNSKFKT